MSQLVLPLDEVQRHLAISAEWDDQPINQTVFVTVSAPSSCHMPDKSPAGRISCSPLAFLNSSVSRSMPLNVRTYEQNYKTLVNPTLHTFLFALSPLLRQPNLR